MELALDRLLCTYYGSRGFLRRGFVSSVHLFKYVVIRNRLNKGRKDHPFNFVLSCARVSLKFLQFALTKPAPAANIKVTRSGLGL